MKRFAFLLSIFFITISSFAQEFERQVIFKGDSVWYAVQHHVLFSSVNDGMQWDTIFNHQDTSEVIFYEGSLDTSKNIFIANEQTIFIFGYLGNAAMLYPKSILYCSSDYGKTWNKTTYVHQYEILDSKYLHKITSNLFFYYLTNGLYAISEDAGKTWQTKRMRTGTDYSYGNVICSENGLMAVRFYYPSSHRGDWSGELYSHDGGITWTLFKDKE